MQPAGRHALNPDITWIFLFVYFNSRLFSGDFASRRIAPAETE
jgi:hypothetical protein